MKTFELENGRKLERVSRWIKIQQAYNVTARHSLAYYRTDKNGYNEGSEKFNPENGTFLDYFRFNGRKYAIEQFLRMDYPLFFEENGKTNYISGYDSENYFNPLLIEISDNGEYVRCYYEQE